MPTYDLGADDLASGLWVIDALRRADLAASNGEARRLIQGGGVRVNDAAVDNPELTLGNDHLNGDGYIKLSVGKKRHALLRTG